MDDLLRETKEQFLLEGQRTYIAINGAGAAALLAFLQAIWSEPAATSLRPWVLWGIIAFAFGVAIGAASYQLRHKALVRGAFDETHYLWRLCYVWIPTVAIGAFLLGLGLPVIGAFCSL